MFIKNSINDRFLKRILNLCLFCLMLWGIPFITTDLASGGTAADTKHERTRSNYTTQINVPVFDNTYANTESGILFMEVPLLHVRAQGLPIKISMRYISGWQNYGTHYGYGWQLNYNMFYTRNQEGDMTVVWENGRIDKFIKQLVPPIEESGHMYPFMCPIDSHDSFREYQPGKFLLQTQGMKYYFDSPIHKRLTRMQDPNGNFLTFNYNTDMCLTSITAKCGRQVQFTYTGGNLIAIIDTNVTPNRSIRLAYDTHNNLIAIVDGQGNAIRYSYDAGHFLTAVTPAIGAATAITYVNGLVKSVIGPSVNKTFFYDTLNKTTTISDVTIGADQIRRYVYDSLGRISAVEDALGSWISAFWDEHNNLVGVIDALNRSTVYTYDSMGNLLTATDHLGNTTRYTYESVFHKLKTISNAKGNTTTYEYDSLGNLILETDPLNNTTRYGYDSSGNRTSRTDANGATTRYDYSEHGELLKITYPDNSTVVYGYDAAGNLTKMVNTHADMIFTYDELNRVIGVNYASHAKLMAYTYNAIGNRISMTDPDGGITQYEYDDANRLIRLINPLGQVTRYTYNANNRLIEKHYHNNTSAYYTYDKASRLLSLINKKSSGELLSSYTYEYNAVGNRTRMIDNNGGVTAYSYDGMNQLTGVVYPNGSFQQYTYDANGNRLSLTDNNGTTLYSYDNADRLQTAGATTYGWDNNGNMIRKIDSNGTTLYSYDFENRLTRVVFPNETANDFKYFADGRRLSKTSASGETIFFYDGYNISIVTNQWGVTTARHTSAGIDGWISGEHGGLSYYYHKDGLGSIAEVTDSAGALVADCHYDAFGIIDNQIGNNFNFYTFTGREYEMNGEIYYYRARYYDPSLGRFLSSDPIGLAGGINFYIYVKNNPINLTDSLGLDSGWASREWHQGAEDRAGQWLENINIPNGPQNPHDSTVSYNDNYKITPPGPPKPPEQGNPGDRYHGTYKDLGPTAQTGQSSGGGIESKPLQNIKPSFYYRKLRPLDSSKAAIPAKQTTFLDTILNMASTGATKLFNIVNDIFGNEVYAATLDAQTQPAALVDLRRIIPFVGPSGTTAVPSTPTGPQIVNSNAVEAAAMDFIDSTDSLNRATVFATKTISRTYDHDYQICNRFHGYTLETAAAVPLPGVLEGHADIPWFWYVSMSKGNLVEETYLFSVFIDEAARTFTIDSRWSADQYPTSESPEYDYIFNFQIWASSAEEAYNLLRRTLENLSDFGPGWTVIFANTAEPVMPSVLIKSANVANTVSIVIQSWLTEPQMVSFTGFVRYPGDRDTSIPFTCDLTIEPGFSKVDLPLYGILDALITVQVNDFTDRIYTGVGSWFPFDDAYLGGGSHVNLILPDCGTAPNLNSNDYLLAGCAEITGVVGLHGWVGMARALNPNDLPVDVSPYQALTFFAKGDGKSYLVKIETNSIRQLDRWDFHQFIFTTSPEWKQFVIPVSAFTQPGNSAGPVPYTGKDVISLSWTSLGDPHESINLAVDRIAFINLPGIHGTTILPNTADTAGPYTVNTQISNTAAIQSVSLVYSLDHGQTYQDVPMNTAGNTFSASIPGQLLGTEVRYFVRVIDANLNVITDPIDLISDVYRFQISDHALALVDDFNDSNNTNMLGGWSGTFASENGGSATTHYDGGFLRLSYDVSNTDNYAGYYSSLNQADLTPYTAVTFRIKGAAGGEKARFGLRDHALKETNIIIGEYLPAGITTEWQKVTIPLAAFTRVSDWSHMENLNINVGNWMESGVGVIYLDDIKFEYIPEVPVVVDNFNDRIGVNGLDGWIWTWNGNGASIEIAYDQSNYIGGQGAGYRISYSGISENEWTLAVWDLAGLNASSYGTLSFNIKGANGNEKPNIYLTSRNGDTETRGFIDIEKFAVVTTDWQRVNIPLQVFVNQGVDLSHLSYFQIGFEWENMEGTVYLDNINIGFDPLISLIIQGTTILPNTADTTGPYAVSTQVNGSAMQSISLVYSVDHGQTYQNVPMDASGNTFSASIPGQSLGTEVRYFVRVIDANLNVITDPIDMISNVYRFQISDHPLALVDDFSDTNNPNILGGWSGTFVSENGGTAMASYDGSSLRLSYDVSNADNYAGYYSMLNQADLTAYNAVTFMIRGAAGGEKVRFGLRDHALKETNIIIGEYLLPGITTAWQKVTIPLAAFTRVSDWSHMENLNINVGNWMGSGMGVIYLDDINFEYIPEVPVLVDNFNDMLKVDGLDGGVWTWNGNGASIETAYDQTNYVGGQGASYRISYSGISENEWALAVWDLVGLNASSYETLSFNIKGANGNEKPNIYLTSRNGDMETRGFIDIEKFVVVTTDWQRVNIPLQVFANQGVDLSHLSYIEVGFEWENMEGTIYLDDININLP